MNAFVNVRDSQSTCQLKMCHFFLFVIHCFLYNYLFLQPLYHWNILPNTKNQCKLMKRCIHALYDSENLHVLTQPSTANAEKWVYHLQKTFQMSTFPGEQVQR